MNKTLITFFTILFCLTSSIGWSADFDKGLAAAQKGDFATALREWTPLAEQGNANAQYNLGQIYKRGQGVPKDIKTALKWYTLAAEQGDAYAQFNLGVMYEMGRGVLQDYKTAVKWYRLAAEQGYASAQYNLGAMYALGMGVLKDYVYAHMWGNIAVSIGGKEKGKVRDFVEKKMNPAQIADAQKLARECIRKNYKGC